MAIEKLPVDYVQDVIDTTVTEKRRYQMITNTDGTISLDDVTTYVMKGSEFGMDDVNKTNGAVNEVIDAVEGIESGAIVVGKASSATNAESATNATNAENATNATNATNAKHANTADSATSADSISNDFILANQAELTFTNNICIISDERITADSLADVYFTGDTISVAEKASITVDTYAGKVELTAGRTPEGTIKASIHIRVV